MAAQSPARAPGQHHDDALPATAPAPFPGWPCCPARQPAACLSPVARCPGWYCDEPAGHRAAWLLRHSKACAVTAYLLAAPA